MDLENLHIHDVRGKHTRQFEIKVTHKPSESNILPEKRERLLSERNPTELPSLWEGMQLRDTKA